MVVEEDVVEALADFVQKVELQPTDEVGKVGNISGAVPQTVGDELRDLLSLDILTAFELFLGAVDGAHEYALEEELVLFADSDQHDAGGVGSKRLPVASRDELR